MNFFQIGQVPTRLPQRVTYTSVYTIIFTTSINDMTDATNGGF